MCWMENLTVNIKIQTVGIKAGVSGAAISK